ncbi:uncharacterized protein [Dendrobates tinctorius]|uniref:uncharacterized protein isoform X3 n=1 Tax=Dendrobates tinctorius TaxID=92724 RepID=UPI003CC99449
MWSAALRVEVSTISDPLNEDLLHKKIFRIYPSRMDMDRDKMAERILHLTLEILFRLTGEDYTVVKRISSEHCQDPVSEGWGGPLSPITGPPPHPMIHEDINEQKILKLLYKMIELLTGEVPIRSQDVTVYFSVEEWEYLEDHKDLYKNVMMEVLQPLTSPVLSSKRTTPERCPRPLLPQDCKQEDPNVPQDHQSEDLTHINTTETYVRGDEGCKEEIPTYGYPADDCTRRAEEQLTSSIFKSDDLEILQDTTEDIVPVNCTKIISHPLEICFPEVKISVCDCGSNHCHVACDTSFPICWAGSRYVHPPSSPALLLSVYEGHTVRHPALHIDLPLHLAFTWYVHPPSSPALLLSVYEGHTVRHPALHIDLPLHLAFTWYVHPPSSPALLLSVYEGHTVRHPALHIDLPLHLAFTWYVHPPSSPALLLSVYEGHTVRHPALHIDLPLHLAFTWYAFQLTPAYPSVIYDLVYSGLIIYIWSTLNCLAKMSRDHSSLLHT